MSTYPQRFLGRLKSLRQLPDSGKYLTRWEARCPGHNDRTPSLSISLAPEGHLLVHCHAGCPAEAVMSAVGLDMSDLYPSPSTSHPKKNASEKSPPNPEPPKPESATPNTSNENARSKKKSRRSDRIKNTYDYYDAEGTLLYQVVRFKPKKFRQRRPNPKGGWIWSTKGVERIPYQLPEMLEAIGEGHPILIVEGEKDVETALRMRSELGASSGRLFSATTAPGGAGKWRSSFARFFKGAHVWIVPDIDEAGFDHARQVAKRLRGVAESIKVLRLPSTTRHFDLSGWAAQGKTGADLLHLADQSPYLLSRAHPTHEVGFEAVPGPSAPMEEIQEYLVSSGSVRSGQAPDDTSTEDISTGETPPEEVSTEEASPEGALKEGASSNEAAAIPPLDEQDEQSTSTGIAPKWEGIGVEVSGGHGSTEATLSGLDQIVSKNRNGEVGFSLPPNDPQRIESSGVAVSSEEADAQEEADTLVTSDAHSPEPDSTDSESITGAAEKSSSRKSGSRENGSLEKGSSENRTGKADSKQKGTSRSLKPRLSHQSSFSAETRAVIDLLEKEGAQVISTGGAFYLVFPFLSSTERVSEKQAGEPQRPAVSGKSYLFESPLIVPLLLRLAYDRKGWIPSPDACRAALLFLTPAVPSPAHVSSRVAAGNGALYIDAGENTILEVKPGEWNARSNAPAIFLRSEYACPLPPPKKRGSLAPLRRLLRIEADEAWIGIRGWLLGTLCPTGPVPPLLLGGDDPRRLSRLARQLVSVFDPTSSAPIGRFQPLLLAGDLSGVNSPDAFPERDAQRAASEVSPFATCLDAKALTGKGPGWLDTASWQSALQTIGSAPSTAELSGQGAARPLGTRLILVGSGPEPSPALRNDVLTVRPTFLKELPSTASTDFDSTAANEEGHSESSVHSEALGVLLAGAAEALDRAGETSLPIEAQKSQYAPFLAWVAAAEAGLSPAALGSGLSGRPSRPFLDVWREGQRRPGLLRRLVQALLRLMGWDSIR